jgi:hypothetical protein
MLVGELTLILDEGETVVRAVEIVIQRGPTAVGPIASASRAALHFVLIDGTYDKGVALRF